MADIVNFWVLKGIEGFTIGSRQHWFLELLLAKKFVCVNRKMSKCVFTLGTMIKKYQRESFKPEMEKFLHHRSNLNS